MQRIKVTKDQKQCLKPLVKRKEIAEAAFCKAAQMIHAAENQLWEKVVDFWPNPLKLKHPNKGNWTIIVDEKDKSQ